MNRRRFLGGLATGAGVGLAGCFSAPRAREGAGAGGRRSVRASGGVTGADYSVSDEDLPIPRSELVRAAPRDGIPAITDPVFGSDWSGITVEGGAAWRGDYTVEPRLQDRDEVIGVVRDGEARAYPLKLLAEHEVVNDTFGGPLLITFCPLCGSSLTARRTVGDEETTFGVSGLLWNWDLVMYDQRTESLWGQIAATAIRGERTGDRLEPVPSSLTRWDTWQGERSDTRVLRPPPDSNTVRGTVSFDYKLDRYGGYDANERIGLGSREFQDDRLHPKTQVVGVESRGTARAYPFRVVDEAGVVNDRVGELPVVVATGPSDTPSVDSGELFAYDRRVEGRAFEFEPAGRGRMTAGGSTWSIPTGRAVDGPHEGRRLAQAGATTAVYWFAWLEFNPETDVYGRNGG